MLPSEELLQSIDILAQNAVKDSVKIYTTIVTAVGDNNTCSVRANGKTYSNIVYYGDTPTVNKSYRVFCPNGSMNQAFIITGGGSSGGGSTGATDYNQLTSRPSINGTTLSGNQTSSQLGLYGTNNTPPYPVTSVNGQTGNVVISTGGNVDSVNGKTGVVVLNATDVGALPDTTVIPDKTSQLDNDSGYITDSALTDYAKKTEIPTKTSELTNDSGYITANDAPVKSVDGATGDVVTNAVKTTAQTLTDTQKQQARTNIGAGTSSFDGDYNSLTNKPTIPTQTSQLTNDANYITAAQAPVQSVNSKTGAVTLSAADVSAIPSTLTGTVGQVLTKTADGQEWKDVEIPSGGGGGGSSQWKIIRDLTITENADRVDINTDDAGEAFSLHEIQVFSYTMSYGDTAEPFTFLMNGYWGSSDPYFISGFKSPKSSDNYYIYNHFIATMQNGIANVFQPWRQYIINSQRGGDVFSIGDKYQAIESVSFVGKFIAGCRFTLVGRVSS